MNCSFSDELPYPQVSLTASKEIHLTLGTKGMNAPNTCSVVLVAGSALHDLQAVMDMVDSLVEDMLQVPYAIFLIARNETVTLNTTRHVQSPPVVSIHCLTLSDMGRGAIISRK